MIWVVDEIVFKVLQFVTFVDSLTKTCSSVKGKMAAKKNSLQQFIWLINWVVLAWGDICNKISCDAVEHI